jgi:hypothetical protein
MSDGRGRRRVDLLCSREMVNDAKRPDGASPPGPEMCAASAATKTGLRPIAIVDEEEAGET